MKLHIQNASVINPLGVDYTCVLNVQFGCAFPGRMRFQFHFQCRKLKNDIENAFDRETHIQTAHPKRKCNQLLKINGQYDGVRYKV
jgi:hypothetical protein